MTTATLGAGGGISLHQVGPHRMWLRDDDEGISATLRSPDGWRQREPEFMRLLAESLSPGDFGVDLGANLGWCTLAMASAVGPGGRVLAIEPVSANVAVLERNIAENGLGQRVEVVHAAVSDAAGQADFHLARASNLGSIVPTSHATGATERVRTWTLDELLRDRPVPRLIKMDVEGHEVEILRGMRGLARRAGAGLRILIEVHPRLYTPERSLERELMALREEGFGFRALASAGCARPDLFVEAGYTPREVFETFGFERAIYEGVRFEDGVRFCARTNPQPIPKLGIVATHIVRSILLEKGVG